MCSPSLELVKNCYGLQTNSRFPIRANAAALSHAASKLTGSAPRRALRAEPAENEFAFAKHALTEGPRGGPGHVVPLEVLNLVAAVADEVVMSRASRIKSRGAPLDGHFTYQTRLHQVPQIVISRSPGRERIHAIHGFEDFRSRGMTVVFHQECHHGITLRSAPQPAAIEGAFNHLGFPQRFRLCLM